ncbi:MAG TPA: BREX-3 system phosphatase PglZ, partial [Lamprocystis sp. (in: g-proteobacteria)]|nr:BREX-3 system phosphatase PglZ [Lamprocystis sp. (in: g-proteobacteria)]
GSRIAEATLPVYGVKIEIPFAHRDIRGLVDSMFLDGTLHPLAVQQFPADLPDWVVIGIVKDPAALRNLVVDGLKALVEALPTTEATHRDWGAFARRFAEALARFHRLDSARAQGLKEDVAQLQRIADERLLAWITEHYADLPSLSAAHAPAMVHQIPRFLAMRRNAGETRVALLVFDGLALDQWVQIREHCGAGFQPAAWKTGRMPVPQAMPAPHRFRFAEGACFAWLPTLTAVSRQALFAGLRPREFADSLETTHREPALWSRFWQDQGLRPGEVLYRKGVRRFDQLDALGVALANPAIQVAGIVVDTIDEIVHGAVLGKRGIASQIATWCESGFVDRLFALLLDQGFHVYLTADHGNCEAVGVGRSNQGVIAETRGERVRVYRSALLRTESAGQFPGTFSLEVPAWPRDFLPLFAAGRSAFVTPGEALVSHGGCSIEEVIVPFVKVSDGR